MSDDEKIPRNPSTDDKPGREQPADETVPPLPFGDAVLPFGDWLLRRLVYLADVLRAPVTLSVGGQVISGELATGKEYIEGTAKLLQEEITRGLRGKGLSKKFSRRRAKEVGDCIFQLGDRYVNPEKQNLFPLGCVHLKNARIHLPGGTGYHVGWYRLRIDRVDGFAFGTPPETQ